MAKDIEYFVSLSLEGNEIKKFVVHNVDALAEAPTKDGGLAFLKADVGEQKKGYYGYNGGKWVRIADEYVIKNVTDRLDAVEEQVGLGTGGGESLVDKVDAIDAEITELKTKDADLQGQITTAKTTADAADTLSKANKTQIDANTTAIANVTNKVTGENGLESKVAALDTAINAETTGLGARVTKNTADIGTNTTEIGKLKTTVGDDTSGLVADVKKNVSDIAGKVDKVEGKGLSTNDYTTEDKNKLAGIASGAQVNVLEGIQINGADATIAAKKVNLDLAKYALKTDIASGVRWKGSEATVAELPPTGNETGDMWHVDDKSAEYIWNGTAWEEVGSIVDLSDYAKSADVTQEITNAVADKADSADVYTKTEVDAAVGKKVNAITGTAPTAGTYKKVTINADGLVTAGLDFTSEDLPSVPATKVTGTLVADNIPALDANKIASGELDPAHIPTITGDKLALVPEEKLALQAKRFDAFTADATTQTIAHGFQGAPYFVQLYKSDGTVFNGVNIVCDANNITLTANIDFGNGFYVTAIGSRKTSA